MSDADTITRSQLEEIERQIEESLDLDGPLDEYYRLDAERRRLTGLVAQAPKTPTKIQQPFLTFTDHQIRERRAGIVKAIASEMEAVDAPLSPDDRIALARHEPRAETAKHLREAAKSRVHELRKRLGELDANLDTLKRAEPFADIDTPDLASQLEETAIRFEELTEQIRDAKALPQGSARRRKAEREFQAMKDSRIELMTEMARRREVEAGSKAMTSWFESKVTERVAKKAEESLEKVKKQIDAGSFGKWEAGALLEKAEQQARQPGEAFVEAVRKEVLGEPPWNGEPA